MVSGLSHNLVLQVLIKLPLQLLFPSKEGRKTTPVSYPVTEKPLQKVNPSAVSSQLTFFYSSSEKTKRYSVEKHRSYSNSLNF